MSAEFKYVGDQMTVEEMEERFADFSKDNWDSYGCRATTPEIIQMLRYLFDQLGRPAWFVAHHNGADFTFDILDNLQIEFAVDSDGLLTSIIIDNYNRDNAEDGWTRAIGERHAWTTENTEQLTT